MGAVQGMDPERSGGVTFPGCPDWWTRAPGHPAGAPRGYVGRSLYAHVLHAAAAYGAEGQVEELPGRLADCIVELRWQQRVARQNAEAEARARPGDTIGRRHA